MRNPAVDDPISAHEAPTKVSDDDSQFYARAADGFCRVAVLQKQDVLKEMLVLLYDAAIRAQFDESIGAELHQRSERRQDQRNVSRTRGLNTQAGSLKLEIPRARNSNFQPTVIEQFRRSERALVSVIQEAFVAGISTRKMEHLLSKMGVDRLSKSQISELCTEVNTRAADFRHRPLTKRYPYLRLDAALTIPL